jgi:hypothetical protein
MFHHSFTPTGVIWLSLLIMKKLVLTTIWFLFTLAVSAQHPLIGTWEMVSISGTNADGEKFYLDTTTVKETKIITATHYMLLARDKEKDQWIMNRCYAGTASMTDTKYIESPVMSSLRIFENVLTDFTWKVEGDRFIQSGTITRPDGKKIILDKFIFTRAKVKPVSAADPYAGTWKLSSGKNEEGMLIITSSTWMQILRSGEKLLDASGGILEETLGKPVAVVQFGSRPNGGDKLLLKPEGKKLNFGGYTFERVD